MEYLILAFVLVVIFSWIGNANNEARVRAEQRKIFEHYEGKMIELEKKMRVVVTKIPEYNKAINEADNYIERLRIWYGSDFENELKRTEEVIKRLKQNKQYRKYKRYKYWRR